MQTAETINTLHAQIKAWHQQQQTIAFVPTMGNLHKGHISLVKRAQEVADKVVVSIFVNPLQFDDKADLSAYPRTLADDLKQLLAINCDLVFTPTAKLIYPNRMDAHTTITVPGMDDKLCGRDRPGHFDGVATVVSKLFNIVQADIAIFGEKDYQQLMLIKKMVADLNIDIEIIGSATCREIDGLAMSSRNQYLTKKQRKKAAELYQTLLYVQSKLEQGEQDFDALQQQAINKLNNASFETDYVEIRRATDLEQAQQGDKALRILAAAR